MTAAAIMRQSDVKRFLMGAKAAGYDDVEIIIEGSKVRLVFGSLDAVRKSEEGKNPFDGIEL